MAELGSLGVMQEPSSTSKRVVISVMITLVALAFLVGCGPNPAEVSVKKLFRPSPDKDVTMSPEYNFSSFAGTVWKTKTKTAIADGKSYTGVHQLSLLPPDRFDPTDPNFTTIPDMKLIAVLPPGTRLRFTRLLQDQGARGGLIVEAIVEDGTNAPKAVYVDRLLLANVWWASQGPTSNTNWGVNPEMLEKP